MNKYAMLTAKGTFTRTHVTMPPFQKAVVGTFALFIIGFNYTKRYYTMPHAHKDHSKPMLMADGTLHPFEHQPRGATEKHSTYKLHEL